MKGKSKMGYAILAVLVIIALVLFLGQNKTVQNYYPTYNNPLQPQPSDTSAQCNLPSAPRCA